MIKKKHNTEAFFLINFPNKHTKFYAMHDKKIGRYIDLIYKNNEISSGGQREHRYDILIEQIKERKLNPKELEFIPNHLSMVFLRTEVLEWELID